ncbi:hypothetical protein TTRE_0000554001 [Trichuris trichiura]|uniref:Uncharacterized protein n=1 Tax=Trichuris trichiura TaxID=36087 RepID=A0A077ZBN8_TRITR|nr:hypothetical protein TTRE_0000554001 [Trichuris trichiura]
MVAVNGQNLVGVTQEYAAKLMSQSGPVVNFEVAKGAALYNGLAHSVGLQQPARAAGTSTHRYSTSDIYHNVQNNRHVVQTVKQPPPAFYNRMYSAGSGGRSGRSMSASSLLHDAYMDGSHPLMRREAGDPSVSPAVATASSDTYLRHRETEMPYTASRMPVHMGRAMTPPAIQVRSPSLMTPNRSPAGGMEPYAHEASQQYSRRPLPPESPHGYGGYGQNKLGNGGVVSGSPLQLVSQGGRTRAHVAVNDSLSAPPAVYLVDQLSNNERFMDLVTSASETNPVSGELENIIDAKLESPSPSSILVHHKNEAKYVYQNADETPRTQVIGGQEVYKDPRQERLKQLKPVEGEKLSFRDKMRLFAKEFNEPTPKPGVKSSSAQREIEMNLNISR